MNLRTLFGVLLIGLSLSSVSHADFYHHERRYSRGFHVVDVGAWHRGRWFHGEYAGRLGWWWIVGPSWHFYASPVYPYPDPNVAPVYIVEVPAASAPPPPTVVQVVQAPPPAAVSAPAPPAQVASAPPPPPPGAQYYYCSNPQGYFPNVKECPGGWAVTPAPGPQ